MDTDIIKITVGNNKGKYVAKVSRRGKWVPITLPCKSMKTCHDRRVKWLLSLERDRTLHIAKQVMALPWKDVYVPVEF